jgi:hypothetical protein
MRWPELHKSCGGAGLARNGTRALIDPRSGLVVANSPVVRWMRANDIRLTPENYEAVAYLGDDSNKCPKCGGLIAEPELWGTGEWCSSCLAKHRLVLKRFANLVAGDWVQ